MMKEVHARIDEMIEQLEATRSEMVASVLRGCQTVRAQAMSTAEARRGARAVAGRKVQLAKAGRARLEDGEQVAWSLLLSPRSNSLTVSLC